MEDERKETTLLAPELILMAMAVHWQILMPGEAPEQTLMLGEALDQGAATLEERDQETLMVEKDLVTLMDPLLMLHQSDHFWVLPRVCLLMTLTR